MRTTSSTPGFHRHDDHPAAHFAERAFASIATATIGIFLLALSAGGIVNPGYAGMHLNLPHNLMLIVAGALSVFVGMGGAVTSARKLCVIAGSAFAVLALLGLFFGGSGDHTIAGIRHAADTRLLRIVPGFLEFGARDHVLHAGLAALYLLSALLGWLGGEDED